MLNSVSTHYYVILGSGIGVPFMTCLEREGGGAVKANIPLISDELYDAE